MRFVLSNVEPLAVVVGRTPWPIFIDSQEPCVVPLAKLRQGFLPNLVKDADVVFAIMAFDRLSSCVAQIHRRIPLLLDRVWPAIPFLPVESIHLVVRFGSCKMHHQSADRVGVLIKENVEISRREPLGRSQYSVAIAHPGEKRNERPDLWGVPCSGPKDVKVRGICLRRLRKRKVGSGKRSRRCTKKIPSTR